MADEANAAIEGQDASGVEAAPAPVKKTTKPKGSLTVAKDDAIFDGEGGYLPRGAKFDAVDDEASAELIDKGFAK